jgi:hypothetical protein
VDRRDDALLQVVPESPRQASIRLRHPLAGDDRSSSLLPPARNLIVGSGDRRLLLIVANNSMFSGGVLT